METRTLNPDKTLASLIHLSTFSKYIIPFGNFIAPLILWTVKKEDPFVNEHGRQALNFQISLFLYFILLVCITISGTLFLGVEFASGELFIFNNNFIDFSNAVQAIPLLIFLGIMGLILLGLLFLEIITVITATIKASEGNLYQYPITINFITSTSVGHHQSKNEQFNNIQNQTL